MYKHQVRNLKRFCSVHFEWIIFLAGLSAIGLMDPYADNGPSFCLFEIMNVPFCPGEGLAHSVAFIFRGDFNSALEANILGPVTLIVLIGRIIWLFTDRVLNTHSNSEYEKSFPLKGR